MRKTGAWLAVHALEQLGIRYTFGIPGVHNTELYDALNNSKQITPILVTHEGGAAFMADALSRVSDGIGTLAIVPAAGFTHAASGIGEALLAGIPMLVIAGGIRSDSGKRYQLHGIDQLELARPLTKAAFRVLNHADVMPTIFAAYQLATAGEPGPVLVELPVNLQLFPGEVGPKLPRWQPAAGAAFGDQSGIARAADLLLQAERPGLFLGWGARHALEQTSAIAAWLGAPVATTLQGLAAFPADHPLHAGFGFGPAAVPAARKAFRDCDCLLAVGTRFGEIATGSFGVTVPAALIHADINPAVFDANYPAQVKLAGDAREVLTALLAELMRRGARPERPSPAGQIARDKRAYLGQWLAHDGRGRVNPARFFAELRAQVADDAIAVVDDGNHTYLTAELFPLHRGGRLIVPSDFNAMGYATPAAIGAKLAQPAHEVFAIVGDGAFMMSCMEIVTAASLGLGIVYYVFHDGELAQIAQAQETPYRRKPCSTLGQLHLEGVALATGAAHVAMSDDGAIAGAIREARGIAATGRPVIVAVAIDYSKRTAFTQGVMRTNFRRLPLAQRLRMAARALRRRLGS
ncbi:acetolactate synthase large subunit [mine drainage metagenome]|uniref:Acetolactate synthase large subunit n=1 Tax=mine drainage metagenome TaxID=410659 RepID=A0A1J5S021_9ZZZZ